MMEAIEFSTKNHKPIHKRVEKPVPRADEVLVRVAFAGICGTDVHIIQGSFPCTDMPFIPGHEFSGVVENLGLAVQHLKKGDRVAVDPNSGCSTCRFCTDGQYQHCQVGGINNTVGIYRSGGWAQYCCVPGTQVFRLPDTISFRQGVLTEPLSCIAHGWDRIQPLDVGARVLILGAGIIGNLWATVLHIQGHRRVVVSEPQEPRRKLFGKLELGYEVLSPDDLKRLSVADPDWKFDLVIDCSGHAPAMEAALPLLNNGGKLCMFGVASPEARMSISPYMMFKKEITILGININPYCFNKALSLSDAMGARYLDYEKLGIREFSLSQHEEAIAALLKGSISKAVFKVSE